MTHCRQLAVVLLLRFLMCSHQLLTLLLVRSYHTRNFFRSLGVQHVLFVCCVQLTQLLLVIACQGGGLLVVRFVDRCYRSYAAHCGIIKLCSRSLCRHDVVLQKLGGYTAFSLVLVLVVLIFGIRPFHIELFRGEDFVDGINRVNSIIVNVNVIVVIVVGRRTFHIKLFTVASSGHFLLQQQTLIFLESQNGNTQRSNIGNNTFFIRSRHVLHIQQSWNTQFCVRTFKCVIQCMS